MKKEEFSIDNKNIKSDRTIALISDIHLKDKIDRYYINSVLGSIDIMHPDYITLAGDYFYGMSSYYSFENPKSTETLKYYLNAFREIAPVVLSLGDRDIGRFHDKEKRAIFKSLESRDIYPLDNENIVLDDLNIMGYMVPKWGYAVDRITGRKRKIIVRDMEQVDFKLYNDKMNILLSHLPNIIIDKYIHERVPQLCQYDVVLSGHQHGGLTEEHAFKLNQLIDKLDDKKILEGCKAFLEELRYAGISLFSRNIIPFISMKTRGMHDVYGTKLIVGRGANPTPNLEDTYVSKIRIYKR